MIAGSSGGSAGGGGSYGGLGSQGGYGGDGSASYSESNMDIAQDFALIMDLQKVEVMEDHCMERIRVWISI